jgi:hypothetical protein
MGQSTPTTTMALDGFVARYAAYRAELHPREQAWFDELVCRARRHSNAINRRPHLDFERPVVLAMLLEGMRETDDARQAARSALDEVHVLRQEVEELTAHYRELAGLLEGALVSLEQAGLARRMRPQSAAEVGRGQRCIGAQSD